jgi:hypothetical protein
MRGDTKSRPANFRLHDVKIFAQNAQGLRQINLYSILLDKARRIVQTLATRLTEYIDLFK